MRGTRPSAYRQLTDWRHQNIWRIPLLLREFYGGYRFYLRNYQYMGLETVVYAFADGE